MPKGKSGLIPSDDERADFTNKLAKFKAENPLPQTGASRKEWKAMRQSPEFWENLLDSVASGHSLMQFARDNGVKPSLMTAWLHRFDEESKEAQEYASARRARAEYMADRIIETTDLVASGDMGPGQGRVVIDSLRWMAARLDPHIWGDKLNIKAEVTHTTQLHLEAVRQMAENVKRKGQAVAEVKAKAVDAEFTEPEEPEEPEEPTAEDLLL